MSDMPLDPAHTAVLCMDYQKAIVDNYAADAETLLSRSARLLTAARAAGARVIYVVVGFRPGFPEVSARNRSFSQIKTRGAGLFSGDGARVHPAVAPEPGDVTVTKHRVSAFAGTDLAMLLRAGEVDTLVLFGIATSGVVLSTVRHAADADYRLVVVGDCCSDRDPEVHRCLVDKVFPRQAAVTRADAVCAALSAPAA